MIADRQHMFRSVSSSPLMECTTFAMAPYSVAAMPAAQTKESFAGDIEELLRNGILGGSSIRTTRAA